MKKHTVTVAIDLTPTWLVMLPVYLAALVDGSLKARNDAAIELERMARIADAAVAFGRSAKTKTDIAYLLAVLAWN
jgi:hypothetical protein